MQKLAYINGTILTLDSQNTIAESLVMEGETIGFVGTTQEALEYAGSEAKVFDLQGKTMLPGFIEAHAHFSEYAASLFLEVDCGCLDSIDAVKEALAQKASTLQPGEWVRGTGFDDSKVSDARHLTRHDLDEACPHNPVYVMHVTCHAGYMNTEGFKISGAWDTPELDRDAEGTPMGVLHRMEQVEPVLSAIPVYSTEQMAEALRNTIPVLHAAGVTGTFDGGIGFLKNPKETFLAYRELEADGELTVRTNLVFMHEYYDEISTGVCAGWEGSDMLYPGAVKFFQDGSIQAFSAALKEDYHTRPGYKGSANWGQEEFDTLISAYHRKGMQIAVHANGDEAIEVTLTAMERAHAECPRQDSRHMIIHCQLVSDEQLQRMRAIGVVPSFFVSHVYYWGERHVRLFLGEERAARINPVESALKLGMLPSLHTDAPITPMTPLVCVAAAVSRMTREGTVLGEEERITALEALRCCTLYGAWAEFQEHKKGTLEVGKLADCVILAENPLSVPAEKIRDIVVEETIVGGVSMFAR